MIIQHKNGACTIKHGGVATAKCKRSVPL